MIVYSHLFCVPFVSFFRAFSVRRRLPFFKCLIEYNTWVVCVCVFTIATHFNQLYQRCKVALTEKFQDGIYWMRSEYTNTWERDKKELIKQ